MPTRTYTLTGIKLPTLDEFAARFKQYGRYAREEGRFLFDHVMTPEAFVAARVVTLELGLPAVSGVARGCYDLVNDPAIQTAVAWRGFVKQFIGALVCVLMEANGFEKEDKKKAVSVKHWNRGEVYRRCDKKPGTATD